MENEITVSSKFTPSKPIRKSLRRNVVKNINVYNQHVKKHMKECSYLEALREGSAPKDAFNLLSLF